MLTYIMGKVDELAEDEIFVGTAFGPIPNQWLRLEADLRQEVERSAGKMVQLGIADRAVKLQEAKAALMVQALLAAARDAGIPREQVRKLGPALRTRLREAAGELEEAVA
jgi:hypothetical protein